MSILLIDRDALLVSCVASLPLPTVTVGYGPRYSQWGVEVVFLTLVPKMQCDLDPWSSIVNKWCNGAGGLVCFFVQREKLSVQTIQNILHLFICVIYMCRDRPVPLRLIRGINPPFVYVLTRTNQMPVPGRLIHSQGHIPNQGRHCFCSLKIS